MPKVRDDIVRPQSGEVRVLGTTAEAARKLSARETPEFMRQAAHLRAVLETC